MSDELTIRELNKRIKAGDIFHVGRLGKVEKARTYNGCPEFYVTGGWTFGKTAVESYDSATGKTRIFEVKK